MEEIPDYFRKLLRMFDSMRGQSVKSSGIPFWDVVVITASDEVQKEAFEIQIKDKQARGRLPLGIPYLVFADPPGPKSGCGGSTMQVISELVNLYGWDKVNTWRIILMTAGGQSQRLPSASVLGKIFTALPIADSDYQMLEVKLALYLPFLRRMSPGVFHPASDCVELYALEDQGEGEEWNFTSPGITALAHPSSLQIGATHGVYVLEDQPPTPGGNKTSKKAEFRTCQKVLQKPSVSRMREEGAVLTDSEQNEFVYSDSLFFFDHEVSRKLCDFYRQESPMNCEIDSYGDFLQPLGTKATIDYTRDTHNVRQVDSNLVSVRQKLYHLLHQVPLHIVALNASKFYHYGTFTEYLYHLTHDPVIAREMDFTRVIQSKMTGGSNSDYSPVRKKMRVNPQGVVMHSVIHEDSELPHRSLIEYSHINVPLIVGEGSVISNCEYLSLSKTHITIPANTFLHTVSLSFKDEVWYTTIVFSIKDNLKKTSSFSSVGGLPYFGQNLNEAMTKLGYEKEKVFTGKGEEDECSLWGARLFPGHSSMSDSFRQALDMIDRLGSKPSSHQHSSPAHPLFSMADVMKRKEINFMLKFRNKIAKMVQEK